MNLPIWIFQSWESLSKYDVKIGHSGPLVNLHWGGMDVSGKTQQDLPVLPLDFVTRVYKSARIPLYVFQLLLDKFASQEKDKYILLSCHFHFWGMCIVYISASVHSIKVFSNKYYKIYLYMA